MHSFRSGLPPVNLAATAACVGPVGSQMFPLEKKCHPGAVDKKSLIIKQLRLALPLAPCHLARRAPRLGPQHVVGDALVSSVLPRWLAVSAHTGRGAPVSAATT